MSCNWSEKMCFVFVSRGYFEFVMAQRDTKAGGKVQLENVPMWSRPSSGGHILSSRKCFTLRSVRRGIHFALELLSQDFENFPFSWCIFIVLSQLGFYKPFGTTFQDSKYLTGWSKNNWTCFSQVFRHLAHHVYRLMYIYIYLCTYHRNSFPVGSYMKPCMSLRDTLAQVKWCAFSLKRNTLSFCLLSIFGPTAINSYLVIVLLLVGTPVWLVINRSTLRSAC